jgi:prolyl oligopeptidase
MRKTLSLSALLVFTITSFAQFNYPVAKKTNQTDNYHGVIVADPYRWLEDDRSAETAAWVNAENKVTFDYLNQIPCRNKFKQAIENFFNYPKYTAPSKKGEYYYFSKNNGLQNQSVLYRQKGLNGTPELVLDPNTLSPDGTTRLGLFSLSKNGDYAVYALSKGGSDWQTFYIMDMKTLQTLSDEVNWVKVSGAAWKGNGFYYSRYPKPEGSALASKNENHQVYYHVVGTSQDKDELIFEDKTHPQRFNQVSTSDDEQYAYLSISDRGAGKDGNALFFRDETKAEKTFTAIVKEPGKFSFSIIDNINNGFLIQTNENAPNEKVILYDPKKPANFNQVILFEKPEPLQSASSVGGKLIATYLKDVTTRAFVYDLKGKLLQEVKMPGLGTASGFGGDKKDATVFYTFSSFNYPPTIFSYEIATGKSTLFRKPEISFSPTNYEVKQVFYPSKDGTKVPMFIVYKKGLALNGKNPTILYGYGGFNISTNPGFNATLIPFLDAGGVYASANLRGGSEYGEKWHEAGMKLKKQNVFDDFIAAGEFLIANKYTSSDFLALRGGSNGGLLVGAVINQRPDLCKVAIPQVGVMDMLRFQKFTIGWNWIADYGTSDKADEFKALYAYSPLHNIKEGVNYPATLITTADHDDRVVPAHSFKYAATLQEKYKGKNPVLIRIDTNSGHGASNTAKNIETLADIYSFIFFNMGVTPKF